MENLKNRRVVAVNAAAASLVRARTLPLSLVLDCSVSCTLRVKRLSHSSPQSVAEREQTHGRAASTPRGRRRQLIEERLRVSVSLDETCERDALDCDSLSSLLSQLLLTGTRPSRPARGRRRARACPPGRTGRPQGGRAAARAAGGAGGAPRRTSRPSRRRRGRPCPPRAAPGSPRAWA